MDSENMPSGARREALPDHASERDPRGLPIDRVGIEELSYPIQVLDRSQQWQHTVAEIALSVRLPQHFKGTHMSRFVEVLNSVHGEMTFRNLPEILSTVQRRLDADVAHIAMRFPYFMTRTAPVSGARSLMEYRCSFEGTKNGSEADFILGVEVPVTSLCPCSKAISERGAHNQRSTVQVELKTTDFIWIEDIVEAVEAVASAPLYALLKREDEKYVTEQAYDNPKFVEDLVRDAVIALRALPGVHWLRVKANNQESIHNHAAVASIAWSASANIEVDATSSVEEHTPAEPFGSWLRKQRNQRRFSQADLARRLGISGSLLSRVERGEKSLSPDSIQRLAEAWALDPLNLQLRAGLLPDDLLDQIRCHPEAFRAWARAHTEPHA
jgi:GTP cyclohydrolase I